MWANSVVTVQKPMSLFYLEVDGSSFGKSSTSYY